MVAAIALNRHISLGDGGPGICWKLLSFAGFWLDERPTSPPP